MTHEQTADDLQGILKTAVEALAESLGSLIGGSVAITAKRLDGLAPGRVLAGGSSYAVVRGRLAEDDADHLLRVAVAAPDAVTLAGKLMMTPDDAVAERRNAGKLEGDDLEAFGEVGNMICSSLDTALREHAPGSTGVRFEDHAAVTDEGGALGDAELVGFEFELRIAEFPASTGWLLLDRETAERWNGGPLGSSPAPAPAHRNADESFEKIPAAPIVGTLAAYLCESRIFDVARRSCRRVGLSLDRRARGEVPNPAAHHEHIVLMDVPVGEDRRFDWCKRLKEYDSEIRVVLLLHYPSRSRVVQGFMARADAILAWPIGEPELSSKLKAMLALVDEPTE